ncbi:MAG: carbon monoxide dehydrogenase subunit G, partial [Pseudomonadota bacterium]
MKMSGTRQLPAAQADVWSALNDVKVLKRCIPGCQSLEKVSDDQLKATVGLKIGPINAKFNGEVTLSDMNPPNSYRISGSGKGGAAGSASGGADVKLEAKDGGTELSYDVDAKVAGKIAQLGARLIDATAAN